MRKMNWLVILLKSREIFLKVSYNTADHYRRYYFAEEHSEGESVLHAYSKLPNLGHNASWLHNFNSLQTGLMAFNYSSHANNLPYCCQHLISKNVALRIFIHFNFSLLLTTTYRMSLNSLARYIRLLYDLSLIHFSSYILSPSFPTKPIKLNHSFLPEKKI